MYRKIATALILSLPLAGWTFAGSMAQSGDGTPASLNSIIQRIKTLESNRDPKCVATATRLENFMYGTPLTAEARFAKVELQKRLIERLWQDGAKRAAAAGRHEVAVDDLAQGIAETLVEQSTPGGAIAVQLPAGGELEIERRDYEHYSAVAYAMRAVLTVEQEQLLKPSDRLPPLGGEAIAELEKLLNVYTLAALQLADKAARGADERELSEARLSAAWGEVGRAPKAAEQAPMQAAAPTKILAPEDFKVTRSIIDQKLAAYEAYNKISMQVFMRNLQVYFARYRWPSDGESGKVFRDGFTDSMVAYVQEILRRGQERALAAGHALIRAEDVDPVIEAYVPYEVNEYEDVIFFPRLGDERVVLEAYDVDSFRDGGIHWRYLQYALDDPKLGLKMELDPFAAELVTEGVAQYGVLALRLAGNIAKETEAESLDVVHLQQGLQELRRRIEANAKAPPVAPRPTQIPSASVQTDTISGSGFFREVTAESGIDFEHRSSDWLSRLLRSYLRTGKDTATLSVPPAFGGAGVAAEDIDNDGDPDILLVGGLRNALYQNQGDGRFLDITAKAGINFLRPDGSHGEPRQPIIADFDNDGNEDIFITYVSDDHRLYRGHGDGSFEDVTAEAGLGGRGLVGGPAVAFDYDRDGLLDIYIGYFGDYVNGVLPTLSRRNTNGLPNKLFHNEGNFRFRDVTKDSGVDNTGWAQAASHTDLDGDGWQDLIVGNDFGVNSYYRNLGNGKFEDIAPKLGTNKPSFTMNVGIADINHDQFPDIYISNIVTLVKDDKYVLPDDKTPMHFTLRGMGRMRVVEANDLFTSVSANAKLSNYVLSDAVGRGYNSTGWAWGADFFDFDNDGDDDLYVLNGMNEYAVYSETPYYTAVHDTHMTITLPTAEKETNVFFVNEGGKLQNRSAGSGVDYLGNSRSAAYLDLEGDGDLDIVVNNYHGPALVYRNELKQSDRNWLKIKLIGDPAKGSNRDAIGARLLLTGPDLQVWREVHGTIGYLSVYPREQHFGLGRAGETKVAITWPNGEKEEIDHLQPNRRYTIAEGKGIVAQ